MIVRFTGREPESISFRTALSMSLWRFTGARRATATSLISSPAEGDLLRVNGVRLDNHVVETPTSQSISHLGTHSNHAGSLITQNLKHVLTDSRRFPFTCERRAVFRVHIATTQFIRDGRQVHR